MNAAEMLRERLAELAAAFALLTRLPVHRLSLPRLTVPLEAVWAYPIVGAAVGAISGAVYWFTHWLSCPPALAAICALAAMIIATGALHEDGLADFADGLAGDTKERSLSIMRDHQIGTYGVIALVLSLAIRATAIALIAEPATVIAALIAADAASRLSAVLIMAALPPARRDGMSASVGSPTAGLAAVALGGVRGGLGVRLLAVDLRIEIGPSGEDQPVDSAEGLLHAVRARRDEQRTAAGVLDGADVRGWHERRLDVPVPELRVGDVGRDPDDGLHPS